MAAGRWSGGWQAYHGVLGPRPAGLLRGEQLVRTSGADVADHQWRHVQRHRPGLKTAL
jgi:hypothetical protein